MDDDKLRSHSYTDSPLTTYELIKQVEIIARTSRNMDVLIDYMLADISYRKERSELYKRISIFYTSCLLYVIYPCKSVDNHVQPYLI